MRRGTARREPAGRGEDRARIVSILNRFDLNLLVVFEAIYAEGGVSRASERLCLTQSAVSHSLRRLRDTVGDPLFARQGQAMVPNDRADQLIGPVRSALAAVARSLEQLGSFDPRTSTRRVRIGIRGFAEPVILPLLFRIVRRYAPSIALEAVPYDRQALAGLLRSRTMDLALDAWSPLGGSTKAERLGSVKLVAMIRPGHPVSRQPLDRELYMRLEHVAASTRRSGLGLEDAVLRGQIRGRNVALRCDNYATAALVAATTDLVLTAPEHFTQVFVGRTALETRDVFPRASVDYGMYYDEDGEEDPMIAWLRTVVRETARDLDAARLPALVPELQPS